MHEELPEKVEQEIAAFAQDMTDKNCACSTINLRYVYRVYHRKPSELAPWNYVFVCANHAGSIRAGGVHSDTHPHIVQYISATGVEGYNNLVRILNGGK